MNRPPTSPRSTSSTTNVHLIHEEIRSAEPLDFLVAAPTTVPVKMARAASSRDSSPTLRDDHPSRQSRARPRPATRGQRKAVRPQPTPGRCHRGRLASWPHPNEAHSQTAWPNRLPAVGSPDRRIAVVPVAYLPRMTAETDVQPAIAAPSPPPPARPDPAEGAWSSRSASIGKHYGALQWFLEVMPPKPADAFSTARALRAAQARRQARPRLPRLPLQPRPGAGQHPQPGRPA